jgi:hypothetical protein
MLGLARAGPHAGFKVVITGIAALSALSISGIRSVECSARGSICAIPEHLAGGHRPRPHRLAADRPVFLMWGPAAVVWKSGHRSSEGLS